VDVGEHAALGDGHAAKELVELLVVADGQLDVAGDDAALLVVAGSVAGELKDLGLGDWRDEGWGGARDGEMERGVRRGRGGNGREARGRGKEWQGARTVRYSRMAAR